MQFFLEELYIAVRWSQKLLGKLSAFKIMKRAVSRFLLSKSFDFYISELNFQYNGLKRGEAKHFQFSQFRIGTVELKIKNFLPFTSIQ